MRQDCREKRAHYIDISVKIREAFYFAHPHEQILATEKYFTALYGSNLWDLASPEAEMVFATWRTGHKLTWRTGHKLAWGVHRGCRTYLLQHVLAPHVTSVRMQCGRQPGAHTARNRPRPLGLRPGPLKAALLAADRVEVPTGEEWKVPFLWRLLTERLQAHYSADMQEETRLQELIDSLVVN